MDLTNQIEVVNMQRLNNIVIVAERTLDLLMHQTGDDTLTKIDGPDSYTNFKKNIDDIIIAKLRKKFEL